VYREREEISRGVAGDLSDRVIAVGLGRDQSVVSREIARNGGRRRYRAYAAQERAQVLVGRPKVFKLEANTGLHDVVAAGLSADWSPQQISARLVSDHPDDPELRVSHETIYQALYLQARGELRTQLKLALRQGRTARSPSAGGVPARAGSAACGWERRLGDARLALNTAHVVRRWKQANKILDEMEAQRRKAGLPEPKFYEHPLVILLGLALPIMLMAFATWLLDNVGALRVGIVLVVALGATGLTLRGVGELDPEPSRGRRFKAWGYFGGAMAYTATASVALFNAVPALFGAS
jgi:IS30 family transposase